MAAMVLRIAEELERLSSEKMPISSSPTRMDGALEREELGSRGTSKRREVVDLSGFVAEERARFRLGVGMDMGGSLKCPFAWEAFRASASGRGVSVLRGSLGFLYSSFGIMTLSLRLPLGESCPVRLGLRPSRGVKGGSRTSLGVRRPLALLSRFATPAETVTLDRTGG